MAIAPGVGFALVLNVGLLLLGFLAYGYWVRTRNSGPSAREQRAEAWALEARALVREVERIADQSGQPVDHDQLCRQLLPLATRIRGHIRTAPCEVDSHTLMNLYDLCQACHRISMDHTNVATLERGVFIEEKVAELRSEAETAEAVIASDGATD